MEELPCISPNPESNKEQKTFRTLDTKKKQGNTPKPQNEQKKIAPTKKKIIKFHFSNPYEYKMSVK